MNEESPTWRTTTYNRTRMDVESHTCSPRYACVMDACVVCVHFPTCARTSAFMMCPVYVTSNPLNWNNVGDITFVD